jgi:hypothetical protein
MREGNFYTKRGIYIMLFLILLISTAAMVMSVYSYRSVKKSNRNLQKIIAEIIAVPLKNHTDALKDINKILGWQTVMPIRGIVGTVIDNAHVKTKDYDLNFDYIQRQYKLFYSMEWAI